MYPLILQSIYFLEIPILTNVRAGPGIRQVSGPCRAARVARGRPAGRRSLISPGPGSLRRRRKRPWGLRWSPACSSQLIPTFPTPPPLPLAPCLPSRAPYAPPSPSGPGTGQPASRPGFARAGSDQEVACRARSVERRRSAHHVGRCWPGPWKRPGPDRTGFF